MEIVLTWEGHFRQPLDTPERLYEKHGVYAIEYKSKVLYIGKAEESSLLPQAKTHSNTIVEYLRKVSEIPNDWSHSQARDFVDRNCLIYIAEISDNQLNWIDCVERCLIFRIQPKINKEHKIEYEGIHSVRIINKGDFPKSFQSILECV